MSNIKFLFPRVTIYSSNQLFENKDERNTKRIVQMMKRKNELTNSSISSKSKIRDKTSDLMVTKTTEESTFKPGYVNKTNVENILLIERKISRQFKDSNTFKSFSISNKKQKLKEFAKTRDDLISYINENPCSESKEINISNLYDETLSEFSNNERERNICCKNIRNDRSKKGGNDGGKNGHGDNNKSNKSNSCNSCSNKDNCSSNYNHNISNLNQFAIKYLKSNQETFVQLNNKLVEKAKALNNDFTPSYQLALNPEISSKNKEANSYEEMNSIKEEKEIESPERKNEDKIRGGKDREIKLREGKLGLESQEGVKNPLSSSKENKAPKTANNSKGNNKPKTCNNKSKRSTKERSNNKPETNAFTFKPLKTIQNTIKNSFKNISLNIKKIKNIFGYNNGGKKEKNDLTSVYKTTQIRPHKFPKESAKTSYTKNSNKTSNNILQQKLTDINNTTNIKEPESKSTILKRQCKDNKLSSRQKLHLRSKTALCEGRKNRLKFNNLGTIKCIDSFINYKSILLNNRAVNNSLEIIRRKKGKIKETSKFRKENNLTKVDSLHSISQDYNSSKTDGNQHNNKQNNKQNALFKVSKFAVDNNNSNTKIKNLNAIKRNNDKITKKEVKNSLGKCDNYKQNNNNNYNNNNSRFDTNLNKKRSIIKVHMNNNLDNLIKNMTLDAIKYKHKNIQSNIDDKLFKNTQTNKSGLKRNNKSISFNQKFNNKKFICN